MEGRESSIIRNFRHYCELDNREEALLLELEKEPIDMAAGEILWEENQPTDSLYALLRGWAYSWRAMDDGNRQVLDIYLPGDVIGLKEIAFSRHLSGVTMLTAGTVCRFSNHYLMSLFGSSQKLTAIFFSILAGQQVLLTERLVNLGRRNARERVAHFIYEMCMRKRRTSPGLQHLFDIPLSQQVVADALGLSAVHVSRIFSELRDMGLIYRNRNEIEIPDPQALIEVTRFSDRYLDDGLHGYFPG